MKRLLKKIVLSGAVAISILTVSSEACTRVMSVEGDRVITSRSMDWKRNFPTNLWIFPRGMDKVGDLGKDPIKWTSKYGSVVAVGYNAVTVDGMNEKGLVANELWETAAKYGESNNSTISVGAFAQYILDNYKNVNEAVKGLEHLSFQITSASLPDNKIKIPKGTTIPFTHRILPIDITINLPTSMHIAISDSTGDSAIVEFMEDELTMKGKMVIHHSSKYKVMSNSPTFDKQLAINEYWQDIGGNAMLPGTHRPADRFVRASFYTENPIKGNKGKVYIENEKMAIAKAFSIIREVSVPLGVSISNSN